MKLSPKQYLVFAGLLAISFTIFCLPAFKRSIPNPAVDRYLQLKLEHEAKANRPIPQGIYFSTAHAGLPGRTPWEIGSVARLPDHCYVTENPYAIQCPRKIVVHSDTPMIPFSCVTGCGFEIVGTLDIDDGQTHYRCVRIYLD